MPLTPPHQKFAGFWKSVLPFPRHLPQYDGPTAVLVGLIITFSEKRKKNKVVQQMTEQSQTLYDQLIEETTRTALLASCSAVLGWDEQTYLPPGGAEHRANQLSLLAGMVHERATSSRVGELILALEEGEDLGEEDSPKNVNVREARRVFDRATKLPRKLVEEISRVSTLSQQVWVEARGKVDFKLFLP